MEYAHLSGSVWAGCPIRRLFLFVIVRTACSRDSVIVKGMTQDEQCILTVHTESHRGAHFSTALHPRVVCNHRGILSTWQTV